MTDRELTIEGLGAGLGEILGLLADITPGIGGGLFLIGSAIVRGVAPEIGSFIGEYLRHRAKLHAQGADLRCAFCHPPEPHGLDR